MTSNQECDCNQVNVFVVFNLFCVICSHSRVIVIKPHLRSKKKKKKPQINFRISQGLWGKNSLTTITVNYRTIKVY